MSEAVKEAPKKERPQITNIHITQLHHDRMPLAALVSILHRISGFLLFALLPLVLYLFGLSVRSPETFDALHNLASQPLVKLVLLALVWAYMQHFCAGVRHLFMDVHVGIEKDSARNSALTVLVVSLALTALVALKLFGVF